MLAKKEAATRHRPVAHGPDTQPHPSRAASREVRRSSETRLQAAVVKDRKRDESDPYADVPCTD
ncbi:MAG: hypothetical protein KF819_05210 [Labilithrix sp.]|nr:hypothetical protein [Labilithrix sp.]